MKSFTEYLTESKKTYAFKIKVAGELPEGFDATLKGAMERFAVVTLSKGKRTPIQESPIDFPELKNTNVTSFDLEVSYPTTPQVLESYLSQVCKVKPGSVLVRTANQDADAHAEIEIKEKKTLDDTLLATEDMGGESAQDQVGEKHVTSFLKDLAAVAKDRKVKDQPTESASEMPESGATDSPIGSTTRKEK